MADAPPGLREAVAAVRQAGGVLLTPESAVVLATVAVAAARIPMVAEIYHDIADDDSLPLPPEAREQLDAIGWYLRNQEA